MAKRRPSGDGMVRKREDGRWEGRIVIGHKDKFDFIGKRLRRAFHFRTHVGARARSRLVLENEPAATAQKHDCQHRNKAKAQPCPKRAWEGAGFGGRPVCLLELSCCWHVREVEFESCLL